MPAKPVGARKAPARRPLGVRERAVANGYRSGLEDKIAEELARKGHEVNFETIKIPFVQPVKPRTYTPDFVLRNGIVIETKGRFMTDDRQKHKLIAAQHPDLDILFLFSNAKTKLSKGSPTSYGAWCEQYGFLFADKAIPQEWLDEAPCEKRIAALGAVAKPTTKKPTV